MRVGLHFSAERIKTMAKIPFTFLGLSSALGMFIPGGLAASVEYDPGIPQLAFAAQELQGALTEAGREDLQVTLIVTPDESSPEAFQIRPLGPTQVEVTGSDATGAMYGGLEVADLLRLGLPIEDQDRKPFVKKRGIKFNIPLDARTPSYDDTGDAAQNNIETVWDFEFWKAYLDDLARYRYNVLSLWSTHPYPSIIKLEEYPEVALDDVYRIGVPIKPDYKNKLQDLDQNDDGYLSVEHDSKVLKLVKKISIEEKISHWQRVFQYAEDRGIEIYLFHWNVFTFGATGKYGITQDQTNPVTVDYTRKCVRQALLTYPQIAGIGVTAGENADRVIKGEHSTENFIFNTFGRGIMDVLEQQPDRKVRFIFRRHVTERDDVTKAFKDYKGGMLDTSIKYAVAHIYSSRRPQEWENRIVEEGWLDNFKVWLNLRNDDIFMHRWGSPDYVREFIKWMPHDHSPGFYMGSDGYVWAREFIAKHPEMSGRLEIDKHWYRFRLWGQLAYNNELGRDYWEAVLKHRFPGVDAKLLYDTWESTSEIIPQLNRSIWAATDGDFSAEGCMQRSGFLTVDDYYFDREPMVLTRIDNAPDPRCISVTEWAKAFLAGKKLKGITPLKVADNLDEFAATAIEALPALRKNVGDSVELKETLNDIESMAYLGRYYADKMCGAAKLAVFREGGRTDKQFNDEAVSHLKDAVEEWKAYSAILSSQYKTQLLARTYFLDWDRLLKEVEKEVVTVKQEGDFPDVSFRNLNDGDSLPAGTDLQVEVEAKDGDGIKEVKLYLNGLLVDAEKKSKDPYVWNGSSDKDLLTNVKMGWYRLEAVAVDKTGITGRQVTYINVGNASEARKDAWKDEIHIVLLNDGEQIKSDKKDETKIKLPRLECWMAFQEDGKFVFRDESANAIIWKTFSKDEPGPHWAEFKNGQLNAYRGEPGDRDVLLWGSKELKDEYKGPSKFGITRDKRVAVFRDEGEKIDFVWRSGK
jgi:hypothetical protein